jgi:hypothetical protein
VGPWAISSQRHISDSSHPCFTACSWDVRAPRESGPISSGSQSLGCKKVNPVRLELRGSCGNSLEATPRPPKSLPRPEALGGNRLSVVEVSTMVALVAVCG